MPVQLVIKAPNQKVTDQNIECELEWTIARLKEHLEEVYPNNPKAEDQKIIYGGRMLLDHLTMKDILRNETGEKHTLHLVCATSRTSNNSPSIESQSDSNASAEPSSSQNNPVNNSVRYRGTRPNSEVTPDTTTSHFSFPQVQVPPGHQMNPEAMAQQVAAMQQFYAYYMAQFMQQAQTAGMPIDPSFSTAFATMGAAPGVASPAAPVIPQAQPNAQRANPNALQANRNVRMNAQGGPVLDDDEEDADNRDWLDWFYIVCRALVLFSVIYFYSSMGRFMVVTGITMLVLMYQGGWFAARPGAQNNNRNENANQNEQPEARQQANEEPVGSPEVEANDDNSEAAQAELQEIQNVMDGVSEPQHQRRAPEQSPFQLFWMFFTSFFTSMIPEQPAPVNIN